MSALPLADEAPSNHSHLTDGPDSGSARTLERVANIGVVALIVGMVLAWLPNYLRWPLYWDTEFFAQIAREWDAGIARPYGDGVCYNWPGQIYLFWIAGKVFGWGQTYAIHLMDALLLSAFCAGTLAWSRRCFGGILPGAMALLGLLAFYLNCSFQLTGQRTWQAALLAAGALMAAQAVSRPWGAAVSGFLLASAMLFRPDVAVWGSGAVVCLLLAARGARRPVRHAARSVLAWSLGGGLGLCLGMLPLLLTGVLGDFIRLFQKGASGQFYDNETVETVSAWALIKTLPWFESLYTYDFRLFLIVLPCLWIAALWRGGAATRINLAVWLWTATIVAVSAYRMPHFIGYLVLPILVALFLSIAPALAALTRDARRGPGAALLVLVLLGLFLVPRIPAYCVPRLAWNTVTSLVAARPVDTAPIFHNGVFTDANRARKWGEYQACLAYLRNGLPRGIAVVNGLDPFGEFAGLTTAFASKRRTVTDVNQLLLPSIPSRIYERMLRKVADDPKSAVIVAARQVDTHPVNAPPAAAKLDRWQVQLVGMLAEHYQPAARFGELEVWVHKPEPVPAIASSRPLDIRIR